jgi:hypothetical protein
MWSVDGGAPEKGPTGAETRASAKMGEPSVNEPVGDTG